MTGRELIVYILENHLEDEPVFKNGTFVGYMSDKKFAETFGVGLSSVRTWILLDRIKDAIMIGDNMYIPINDFSSMKNDQKETQGSCSK